MHRALIALPLALIGCPSDPPPPVVVCGVSASIEPVGSVPFTSVVRVDVTGQNAFSAIIDVQKHLDDQTIEVPMTVVEEPFGAGRHVLIADGGFEPGAEYSVTVTACDDRVVGRSQFETTDQPGEVSDWGALDGATWVLDLPNAQDKTGSAGTGEMPPVVTLRTTDTGLVAVELGYFDPDELGWFVCPGIFDLSADVAGSQFATFDRGLTHSGQSTWSHTFYPRETTLAVSCTVGESPAALHGCTVHSVNESIITECPEYAGDGCYPCPWDDQVICAEAVFTGVPTKPLSVPRPVPFEDEQCLFDD